MNSNLLHLIPIIVVDLATKLVDSNIGEHEKNNYVMRIEAIKEYCDYALNKHNTVKNLNLKKKKIIR
jgi:hypothetical protein